MVSDAAKEGVRPIRRPYEAAPDEPGVVLDLEWGFTAPPEPEKREIKNRKAV